MIVWFKNRKLHGPLSSLHCRLHYGFPEPSPLTMVAGQNVQSIKRKWNEFKFHYSIGSKNGLIGWTVEPVDRWLRWHNIFKALRCHCTTMFFPLTCYLAETSYTTDLAVEAKSLGENDVSLPRQRKEQSLFLRYLSVLRRDSSWHKLCQRYEAQLSESCKVCHASGNSRGFWLPCTWSSLATTSRPRNDTLQPQEGPPHPRNPLHFSPSGEEPKDDSSVPAVKVHRLGDWCVRYEFDMCRPWSCVTWSFRLKIITM